MDVSQVVMIVSVTAAVFVVIAIGGAARYARWISQEADAGMLKLIIRVLVPCFIFKNVVGNEAFEDASNVFLPPLWGFLAVGLGCLVAYCSGALGGKWLGLDTARKVQTFAVCVGIFNYGFVPIPLVEQIFGSRALGVLFLHNVGVELGIWSIGVSVISGGLTKGWWKHVLNPPSLTILASLMINALGLAPYVPEFVEQVAGIFASAAIPMMMLLIGATFYDQLATQQSDQSSGSPWPTYGASVLLRLGVLPILFLVLAWWLPISVELKQVAAIQAAMPCALFPIVLTKLYGGHSQTAVRTVTITTIVGFVTIPLWVSAAITALGLTDTVLMATSEETKMQVELVKVQPIRIVGISVRTNNNTESQADSAKIPSLYERYFDEELDDVIPEIDQTPTQSQRRYAVYADYDSDENGDYSILVGKQVASDAEIPEQFEGTTIDRGNYLKFVGHGHPPEMVKATWEQIWDYFQTSDTHTRAFTTDFEVYDESKPGQVEIYIAVQ